jgi:hypothetical protein
MNCSNRIKSPSSPQNGGRSSDNVGVRTSVAATSVSKFHFQNPELVQGILNLKRNKKLVYTGSILAMKRPQNLFRVSLT